MIPSKLEVKGHQYHLVEPSPWPLVASMAALVLTIGLVLFMHHYGILVLVIGGGLTVFSAIGWWRDVLIEANIQKQHTPVVQQGLKIGVALFILSEVMLFFSLFWAYFDISIFQAEIWPPKDIKPLDPFEWPYLNTLLLLLSGTTLTWAHAALLENNKKDLLKGLGLTVILGIVFLGVQAYEYAHASFLFKGGIYPSLFYMATGFHGVHVLIGVIFLIVCWRRALNGHFTPNQHVGFEAAAWYWHFVDVVWIFLFISIYWLGAK